MLVPLVLVLMNIVYALAAYPAGVLSDRVNRITLLSVGFGFLVVADLALAFTNGIAGVAAGVALWGLHMGFTQGLLATLVADTAPPELRGTAYGMFNLLSGLALLVASVLAGELWEHIGPQGTFLAGAVFTVLAFAGLAMARRIAPNVGDGGKSG
jgi:MFS family permease